MSTTGPAQFARRRFARTFLAGVVALTAGTAAFADGDEFSSPAYGQLRSGDSAPSVDVVPEVMEKARETAGIDERLGQTLPLDLQFTDSTGETVTLGDYFKGDRPVLIQMAYYRCPKLCGEISQGMVRSMRSLASDLEISKDFEVLTISFDSRESAELAAANKEAVVDVLERDWPVEHVEAGWGHLVGDDLNIKKLTDALGYRFGWIAEAQQYSHPAVLVVATPDGKISRYLYGVTFEPQTLRLSLIDGSNGTITPSLKDAFVLSCFDYDPTTGKYTATAYTAMRIAGAVTVVAMAGVIGFMLFVEKKGRLRRHPMAGTPIDEADDSEGGQPKPPATAFTS